jgi:hypothetical protein
MPQSVTKLISFRGNPANNSDESVYTTAMLGVGLLAQSPRTFRLPGNFREAVDRRLKD